MNDTDRASIEAMFTKQLAEFALEQTESLESAIMEGLSTISDEPKEKWKLYISGVFEIYKENLAAIRDGRKSRMSEVLRGIAMREMNP